MTPIGAGAETDTAETTTAANTDDNEEEGCAAAMMRDERKLQYSPRTYQMELFERAKNQNTIIHLGTGCGKTLIAILSIRHFLEKDSTRQALFIVPSVALAVQHSRTLQANLPYKVQTACSIVHYSEQLRKELATAEVLVATHGAILDLYRHYGDLFHLKNVSLLVFDECHYAGTGKHGQALFMEEFYARERGSKPRVLGLTASPIINLSKKKLKAEGGLSSQIDELENKLDAEVVLLSSSKSSKEANNDTDDDDSSSSSLTDLEDPLQQKIDEVLVEYDDSSSASEGMIDSQCYLPNQEKFGIHKVRKKEIVQLVKLHEELGPHVTEVYSRVLRNELSRDRYDGETDIQYKEMLRYLEELCEQCSKQRRICPNKGRTDKLMQLEKLLFNLLSDCSNENVGILFVEMRITALALDVYFQQLLRDQDITSLKIRSDKLVRKATHLFKYLHRSHHVGNNCEKEDIMKEVEVEWRHQIDSIQKVLDRLRRKETDLLIATSIVEEGVDVPACSFVIVFDGLKTTKGYIQMKGRARQKKAKLFVFSNINQHGTKPPVCLEDAREAESLVGEYFKSRKSREYTSKATPCRIPNGVMLPGEKEALFYLEYSSKYGQVNIKSAKSLLNLYCQSIPIDSYSRSLRELLDVHMPRYSDYELVLPAHLPAEKRTVRLPEIYHEKGKKFRHSALALMACVRLHKLNLLNDRLLPLIGKDMYQRLLSQTVSKFPEPIEISKNLCLPSSDEDMKTVFMYPLVQRGDVFCQNDNVLQPSRKRRLSILVPARLPEIPRFCFAHAELGEVLCEMEEVIELDVSYSDWRICTQFFLTIMHGRWRRRTSHVYFSYKDDYGLGEVNPPCFVGAIDDENNLDLNYMKAIIADYERTDEERRESASNAGHMSQPRIWAPLYSPNSSYIAFGPSHLNCNAEFPSDRKNYNSYADYIERNYNVVLNPTSHLFVSQRLWVLPNKMVELERGIKGNKRKRHEKTSKQKPLNEGEEAQLDGLDAVLMPQEACMEARISDPALFLHLVFLPAFLYHLERRLVGHEFVLHCKENLPFLKTYLSSENISMEDILEALTAKSCTLKLSYDRLEYIGDAVLKLAQTDALLNSTQLRDWVSCLHEGHLTALRSALGSNSRLNNAAVSMSIDKFIMLVPLGRGMWLPSTLQSEIRVPGEETQQKINTANYNLSVKVCADVIEAIIGLIFIKFGFSDAIKVVEGLQVSLETDTKDIAPRNRDYRGSSKIREHAKLFLGRQTFNDESLLVEALTHPSCLHKDVPSYQKLEWVGDAVLCLMVREFIFREYPQHTVGRLNLIEITLVCNESLAYLSVNGGLHRCISHENLSLPHRIRDFSEDISGKEQQSLWGTEPPKALADVVESLLGAAHIDGGYEAGQSAAAYVLRPMLTKVQRNLESSSSALAMMHPKQLMYEICGQTLKTRIWKEHEFTSKHPGALVYQGSNFVEPNAHGDGLVCQVTCCGVQLLAVLDSRHHVARNRACALIGAVFKDPLGKMTLDLKRWFARNADVNNARPRVRQRENN